MMHTLRIDGREVPPPADDDPHGWTILYQTPACNHVHRVLGWVGTRQRANTLSLAAAAMFHPVLRATAIPAPASDMPAEACGVVTDCPPEILERVHRGEQVPPEDMIAAGVQYADMLDEVMPPPIMACHRLIELLEAKGVDVPALLRGAGSAHNAHHAIMNAGDEELWDRLISEFPADEMGLEE